jgi:biopolymer transport protein ExbB/TolQ
MDDKRFDRLELKIDDISDQLSESNAIQMAHKVILEEHMRRTEANERAIEMLAEDLKPIRKHVNMVQGAAALLGLIATIAGIIAVFK